LEWIVVSEGGNIDQQDRQGRSALDIGKASKALAAVKWIKERHAKTVLGSFFNKHFRRRLEIQRKHKTAFAACKMQALYRGILARKSFRGMLLIRVEASQRFQIIWKENIEVVVNFDVDGPSSWSSIRNLHEKRLSQVDDLDEIIELGGKLDVAASSSALQDVCEPEIDENEEAVEISAQISTTEFHPDFSCDLTIETRIHLSSYVVKWLRQTDPKFREFFVRRFVQLQRGDRSGILAKRLKGSRSTIFETYLEQKSGHRILWQQNNEDDSILIWFVAKHKNGSRLMRLIDDSQSRSARQRMSTNATLPEITSINNTCKINDETRTHHILLNPFGNVPLKMYEVEPQTLTKSLVMGGRRAYI
jgi:hypothetical protein